ncbi:SDR family oxidoreductase [Mesorhizobium sp. LSHC422A00]|uniref:SDR family NAD(P)-dependent oxidoreductase n=1 Tax=Mesorhizobium sp. LSHC422A00 TaxID=1287294 RepID=UPI0004CE5149|nr:SDR family oxidoreductase [Mesorhizobium sp. LSHC422A00]
MVDERKVAIITGASRGIGAALTRAYREQNYRVVATARSMEWPSDDDVLVVAGDVSDPNTAQRVIAAGIGNFGRIDTLVNNAGVFISKPFDLYTANDLTALHGVNIAGFFYITQLAAREMEKRSSGHIVQVTTSLIAHPNTAVPAALVALTKGGLNAATRSLAVEYASRGIRVNAVSPGVIKTTMHPVQTHEALGALHPIGRMGEIADVVQAILYLESAAFVTGEILHVDGGQSAGH